MPHDYENVYTRTRETIIQRSPRVACPPSFARQVYLARFLIVAEIRDFPWPMTISTETVVQNKHLWNIKPFAQKCFQLVNVGPAEEESEDCLVLRDSVLKALSSHCLP